MNRREALKLIGALPAVAPAVVESLAAAEALPSVLGSPWWNSCPIGTEVLTVEKLKAAFARAEKDLAFIRRYSVSAQDLFSRRGRA